MSSLFYYKQKKMGIAIYVCTTVVRMAHQVLQCLWIHACACHVAAVGMAADMGRDVGNLDSVRVLDNQIIVYRHLEGRPQNAANSFYRAVALAVLLQLDEKELRIGNLNLADFLPAEWLVLHQVSYKIVVHQGVWFDAGLGRKVTVDKLLNRNVLLTARHEVNHIFFKPRSDDEIPQRETGRDHTTLE